MSCFVSMKHIFLILVFTSRFYSSSMKNNWNYSNNLSGLAQIFKNRFESQSHCYDKVKYFQLPPYGLGAVLHMWSQALCNALEEKSSLLLMNASHWVWNDRKFCGDNSQPLYCYFQFESKCPDNSGNKPEIISHSNSVNMCPTWIQDDITRMNFRSATMEYLFSRVSPSLLKMVNESIKEIFGSAGIPNDMITIHLRAGDKAKEMRLISDQVFIMTIDKLLLQYNISNPPTIFVVTENTETWHSFNRALREESRTHWKVFRYSPESHKETGLDRFPIQAAAASDGETGLASMISLLIALESKYYVLTTGSNWSRLIDELRRVVVDAKHHRQTVMVDLNSINKYGNW